MKVHSGAALPHTRPVQQSAAKSLGALSALSSVDTVRFKGESEAKAPRTPVIRTVAGTVLGSAAGGMGLPTLVANSNINFHTDPISGIGLAIMLLLASLAVGTVGGGIAGGLLGRRLDKKAAAQIPQTPPAE